MSLECCSGQTANQRSEPECFMSAETNINSKSFVYIEIKLGYESEGTCSDLLKFIMSGALCDFSISQKIFIVTE